MKDKIVQQHFCFGPLCVPIYLNQSDKYSLFYEHILESTETEQRYKMTLLVKDFFLSEENEYFYKLYENVKHQALEEIRKKDGIHALYSVKLIVPKVMYDYLYEKELASENN